MLLKTNHLTPNVFFWHINNGHKERSLNLKLNFYVVLNNWWHFINPIFLCFLCVVCRLSETSHLLTPQSDMDSGSSEEFYQAVHHAEQTFRKMESYLKQQQLCDVILIVGNRKIPAHRYSNLPLSEIWMHIFIMMVWYIEFKILYK